VKSSKSKILIIYTGGTIGMVEDHVSKTLKPFDFNQINKELPELRKIKCHIDAVSFKNPIDSSNVSPVIWEKIGDYINSKYNDYDGFVVLHGTDTMSYTASALSFMFQHLNKPIIFTGSQLPIGMVRTDGKENLITAIEIAATKKEGEPVVQEVAIYFEYQLYRANRTTKISSEHFEAFKSYNFPPLAIAGIDINYNHSVLYRPSIKKMNYIKGFDTNVLVIVFFPGLDLESIKEMIQNSSCKVVVLMTYGSGNIPMSDKITKLIKKQIKKGKIFLNVSQCKAGRVEQQKYETGIQLHNLGVLGVYDMTLEAVISKTMLYLHKFPNDVSQFTTEFLTEKAGEFSI
tara:strand:- start:896 stop:1930 length:1035 start_codon:yes stop_codon:yes gene_type:complete